MTEAIDLRTTPTHTVSSVPYHRWMRRDLHLRGAALDVYALVNAASLERGEGFCLVMSNAQIADYLCCDRGTVKAVMRRLEADGLVRRVCDVLHPNGGMPGGAWVAVRPHVENPDPDPTPRVVFCRRDGGSDTRNAPCADRPNTVAESTGKRSRPAGSTGFQQPPLNVLNSPKTEGRGRRGKEERAEAASRLAAELRRVCPSAMDVWGDIRENCWREQDRRGLYEDEALASYLGLVERGMHPSMILSAVIEQSLWFSGDGAGARRGRYSLSRFLDPENPNVNILKTCREQGVDLGTRKGARRRPVGDSGKEKRPAAVGSAKAPGRPGAAAARVAASPIDPRSTSMTVEQLRAYLRAS